TRPRPVPVGREPPTEEHTTDALDEHADAVELLHGLDWITDSHRSTAQDPRPQAAAMNERAKQRLSRQLLQMAARPAQLRPAAEPLAAPEHAPDEIVQPHAARRDVPPQLAGGCCHLVGDLAFDEGHVAADAAVTPVARAVGVPVALEADARDGLGYD